MSGAKVTSKSQSKFSKSRLLLGNPYAFVDEFGESNRPAENNTESANPGAAISSDRIRLENPYAHVEHCLPSSSSSKGTPLEGERVQRPTDSRQDGTLKAAGARSLTDREIEARANSLLKGLWQNRRVLWNDNPPGDTAQVIDPFVALEQYGYTVVHEEGLGSFRKGEDSIEVAGLIDRATRTVSISRQFSYPVRAFTAAHELAHAVLHPNGRGVHRDRAIDGSRLARSTEEREADKFASYFLMPEKLVRSRFLSVFGTLSFDLNEGTAFALFGLPLHEARLKAKNLRAAAQILSSTARYNGVDIVPLNQQFRVSNTAMAIRLEELGLIELW